MTVDSKKRCCCKKKRRKRMAANEEEAEVCMGKEQFRCRFISTNLKLLLTPAPPPSLVLAPRIGYLPLLVSLIKPYFKDSLPPGEDSIWFEYKGLPLKWYIPTGVLFDLLCAEPQRPWNLTIHFRGYPINLLIQCEGEDSIKWNFVNSLKEAAYITNGNCKNVMNMSQSDQEDLWTFIMNGDPDAYTRVSPKLKMGNIQDEFSSKARFSSPQSRQGGGTEIDVAGQLKTARIPVRLYVRSISKDFENLEDVPEIDTLDEISYLNRPVESSVKKGNALLYATPLKDSSQSTELKRVEKEPRMYQTSRRRRGEKSKW